MLIAISYSLGAKWRISKVVNTSDFLSEGRRSNLLFATIFIEDFPQRLWRGVRVILSDLSGVGSNPTVSTFIYAVYPNGEEAVLKIVALKGVAGSSPVYGAS